MHKFLRVTAFWLTMIGGVGALTSWLDHEASPLVWAFRIGSMLLCGSGLGMLIFQKTSTDLAPDYLGRSVPRFFERKGFCFGFSMSVQDGVCVFHVPFQSRYERHSIVRISFRPTNREHQGMTFQIQCGPAAFGIAHVPIPVPPGWRGRRIRLEVGATVTYPQGKGRQLRFRSGVPVNVDARFRDSVGGVLRALTGRVRIVGARFQVDVPEDARDSLPTDVGPEMRTIWMLGDKPLADPADATIPADERVS